MVILCIFAFMVGLEQMIKIIMGNYLLGSICLAASNTLDALIVFFGSTPTQKGVLGINYERFGDFFTDAKTLIVLGLYMILLFVLFKKTKLSIELPQDDIAQKALYVITVPLTVLSMILALEIAVLGMKIMDVQALQLFAQNITSSKFIAYFITLSPLRILLHGLLTILLTTGIKMKYRSEWSGIA